MLVTPNAKMVKHQKAFYSITNPVGPRPMR